MTYDLEDDRTFDKLALKAARVGLARGDALGTIAQRLLASTEPDDIIAGAQLIKLIADRDHYHLKSNNQKRCLRDLNKHIRALYDAFENPKSLARLRLAKLEASRERRAEA